MLISWTNKERSAVSVCDCEYVSPRCTRSTQQVSLLHIVAAMLSARGQYQNWPTQKFQSCSILPHPHRSREGCPRDLVVSHGKETVPLSQAE